MDTRRATPQRGYTQSLSRRRPLEKKEPVVANVNALLLQERASSVQRGVERFRRVAQGRFIPGNLIENLRTLGGAKNSATVEALDRNFELSEIKLHR